MVTYKIDLDLDVTPGSVPKIVHVKQYQTDATLEFHLYSRRGTLTVGTVTDCSIRGTKSDGNGVSVGDPYVSFDTRTNTVTVNITDQMTAVAGRQPYEITVTDETGKMITATFYLDVQRAAFDMDTPSASVIRELVEALDHSAEIIQAYNQSLYDDTPTANSNHAVKSRGVKTYVDTKVQNSINAYSQTVNASLNTKLNAPPAGRAGQVLRTRGGNTTEWADVGLPTDEQTAQAVGNWLDDHPEATTTVVDGSITNKKLSESLQKQLFSKPFFDVTDYGINPDTDTDVYDDIFDFLHNVVSPTGGVVYFPEGRYIISDCVFIPENTTFMGAGKDTEIYFDGSHTGFGVGLSNGGDNVTICNMTINHLDTANIKTTRGQSYIGGIGYSTFNFSTWTSKHISAGSVTRSKHTGCYVYNLWSDSTYVLQTEPSTTYGIDDVIYSNINAPSSLVSIHPHNVDGYINNVLVENVTCGLFRCGVGHDNAHNVRISRLQCSEIFVPDTCVIDGASVTSDIDPDWHWYNGAVAFSNNVVLKNIFIKGGGVFTRALQNITSAGDRATLYNVRTSGFSSILTNSSNDGYLIFICCDFEGYSLTVSKGIAFGCNATFANMSDFHDYGTISFIKQTGQYTVGDNYRWSNTRWPCTVSRVGNVVTIQGALVFSDKTNLLTVPEVYIKENAYIVVTLLYFNETSGKVEDSTQCLAMCDAEGVFKIQNMLQDITNYNRVIFSGSYSIT